MKAQVGRWGNSLAVRLPKAFVDQFDISEGREIDLDALGVALEAEGKEEAIRRREDAIAAIRARAWIPADFKFDREAMYDEEMEERHGKFWR